jgi:hypothetical protein
MADLSLPVTFRSQNLNTVAQDSDGIYGCQISTFDHSEVDIRQFTEPLSLDIGIDVGRAWLGARHARMTGTVYGRTRAETLAALAAIEAVMLPEEGTFGLYALVFYTNPTDRTEYMARPNGLRYTLERRKTGGVASSDLAISWVVTFLIVSSYVHTAPGATLYTSRYAWQSDAGTAGTAWHARSWTLQKRTGYSDTFTVFPSYLSFPIELIGEVTVYTAAYNDRTFMTWRAYPGAKFCRLTAKLITVKNSSANAYTLTWTLRKCSWGAATPTWDQAGTVIGTGTVTVPGSSSGNVITDVEETWAVGSEDQQVYLSVTVDPGIVGNDDVVSYLSAYWDPVQFGIEQLDDAWPT